MHVPLVDLKAQYASIRAEVDRAICAVVESAGFIGGPELDAFEREFAAFCGTRFAIGVSNGTDAIRLALIACGVQLGDEVVTVPHTFIATTEAISMVGAQIRFVDIDPHTMTMSPALLSRAIGPRTRVVLPVHLYGRPAQMDEICRIADNAGVTVIGDAAQAHGSSFLGRKLAGYGHASTYSFYPGKNLGAYGDAGAVATNDASVAKSISMLRDHGREQKYSHAREGFNCRMDAIQAAILRAKLPHLEQWNARRIAIAKRYCEELRDVPGITLPGLDEHCTQVFHLFVIRSSRRDRFVSKLKERGIDAGIHYPVPLHLQPAYRHLSLGPGSFPAAESAASEVLSLPIYPEMTGEQVQYVVDQSRNIAGLLA